MGLDDIVQAAAKAGDEASAMQVRRFADQVNQRTFGETVYTETRAGVAIDSYLTPSVDMPSSFVIDPNDPRRVSKSVLRGDPLPEDVAPRRYDEDVFDAQEEWLDKAVQGLTDELGIDATPNTRIRRDFPGPNETGTTTFIPHAQFNDPVEQTDLLRFMDRFPDALRRAWGGLKSDLGQTL